MSRKNSISIIEALFPADSKYPETASIGLELCLRAIALHWKDLPDKVLLTYARLCEIEEKTQGKRMF